MFHDFPYTDYHELNLDWLMRCCGKGLGLKLELQGNYLRLVNSKNEVVSQVLVHYADTALQDIDGRDIQTYIFSAGVSGDNLVFVHGDNSVTTITLPFATKASKDVQGKDLLDYVYTVSVSGDKLKITKGDGDVVELTIPFAVKASTDTDGKDITTYAASLGVDGNTIVLRDAKGRQLNQITVPYATAAGTADEATHADDADHADEADEATHALDADAADYATLSTDATNAVENIVISGDQLIATTYGGQQFALTIPYAIKAQKDDAGNVIKTTYVANVAQDSQTGEITFYDATGTAITSLVPTASVATYDSYNNLIADYIKSLAVSQGSDYITVTHGTGAVDSIKVDYANRAWKDTNDNVIKNFYVSWLTCVEDVDDGHWKLVMWNGDTPRAEIGRVEVYAYAAQCDVNGKALTSYIANVDINANNNPIFLDGENNQVAGISGSVTSTPAGSVSVSLSSGTLPSASYDSGTQTLTFNPGAFPTVSSASFTGTQATDPVVFAQ